MLGLLTLHCWLEVAKANGDGKHVVFIFKQFGVQEMKKSEKNFFERKASE